MNEMSTEIKQELQKALNSTKKRLFDEMNIDGFWEGQLSSSPLSTAVAVFTLAQADIKLYLNEIKNGLAWLVSNINSDGGWGDSPGSKTNLSTTLLCWSAFTLTKHTDDNYNTIIEKTETWLKNRVGSLEPKNIAAAVLEYYGNDRTFSAPILTMCALAGRLGNNSNVWNLIPQLPFEIAALPHQLFKWLRLPVVSYAIPALITIGVVKHKHSPTKSIIIRYIRNKITTRTLKILTGIQPDNGGFLEATPLTSFVTMSMVRAGYKDHKVVKRAIKFILQSQLADGSWAIDTNLATWLTTLSINAMNAQQNLNQEQITRLQDWLLNQQYKTEHVFTHTAPGGWSWTDLPGGVPDADDTSGVLLALKNLGQIDTRTRQAATAGITWLLDLQNKDGGIPTFCKGWGKLPFDRSCPDISAHALRAFAAWRNELDVLIQQKIDKAINKGIIYLKNSQREDGSWLPLWFGNQWAEGEENPTYGTAQVVMALQHEELIDRAGVEEILQKGQEWLLSIQNSDGGWGSTKNIESTIEETALAVNALSSNGKLKPVINGAQWLSRKMNGNSDLKASPIGLYFASLWYYEKLYPIIFSVSALQKVLN